MFRYLSAAPLLFVAMTTAGLASAVELTTLTIPIDSNWRAIGPVGDLTGQRQ